MDLSFKQFTIYLALVSLGGGGGWLASRYVQTNNPDRLSATVAIVKHIPAVSPPRVTEDPVVDRSSSNFIADAAEIVGPTVVRIDATRKSAQDVPDAFKNPLFKRFFGNQIPTNEDRVRRGTGSGFILHSDGRIITNAHVVDGADTVQVTLKDGRVLEGKVKGVDPITDVAAVKIDGKELPTAPIGFSDHLVPGQWAIAIGNPLGLDNTVTIGIISATDRSSTQVGIPDKRVRFIQTDAAINPGNSGGPLLNDQGHVIGINTAIRANAQGLGFAIPIETAIRIASQLFAKGKADHPYLGVQMVELSPVVKAEMNQQLSVKLTQDTGVIVVRVVEDSPAAQMGILKGDILTAIDGVAVNTPAQVQEQIETKTVGEELPVEINRQGQQQTLMIKTAVFPESALAGEFNN
ncbi:HhoA/HhoB/HtrA family serine endopeptidase [Planktothrix agardhii]|jgi:S1-C subfamily serine protease|uniref:Serine protease HhoB n=2 Tax=Planktothrix agardhii TaxID=1160 RepID=A0A1J1JGV5_PLAAG|nr:HhoA/HhoB/HtrA family serine endopeptidase [Planktothrix agardhii]BBD54610.1 serine proteinase [Planktothrix agardhii NIES-204]MCB8752473.1 trypsin-like peptidase domain-containing protein [Planktothrix agardhii 1810]MCB8761507.1 trypsin-like peptidase domain-containing protein [Planktothrix agardhii 1813]MCB8762722.1 trypsin-like peptidase domain-containing protein [Planktothrix agardhii 1809]MCB8776319.1 trypsin-like peptidase domain-containing protein [Planktothrix agardhii 1031]